MIAQGMRSLRLTNKTSFVQPSVTRTRRVRCMASGTEGKLDKR